MIEIVTYPNPILRQVMGETLNPDAKETVKGLMEQVEIRLQTDRPFVGLAANQIGIPHRVCVIQRDNGSWLPLINPYITYYSPETSVEIEGCGSLPGFVAKVERPSGIVLKCHTHMGMALTGWEARIAQHEIDHLNGVLIIDRASLVDSAFTFRDPPIEIEDQMIEKVIATQEAKVKTYKILKARGLPIPLGLDIGEFDSLDE